MERVKDRFMGKIVLIFLAQYRTMFIELPLRGALRIFEEYTLAKYDYQNPRPPFDLISLS